MDQLLLDAKRLASRLREHNASSDALIGQANNLHFKVDAMKQYHDVVRDLNEVANRRPRSTLILGSQEENARIRELQQENIELQTSVAEYQSALELIMAKYREQVFGLIKANRLDASCMKLNNYKELQAKTEQICEMAAVMAQAIYIDDEAIQQEQEKMASIESENKGLRELLKISGIPFPGTGTSEEEGSPENDPDIARPSTPKE